MTVRYFWDIDNVGTPGCHEEKDVVHMIQKEFGMGERFEVVGNEDLHLVEPLCAVANFHHAVDRRQSQELLKQKIASPVWHKDDKLVLISEDDDFAQPLCNLKKTGVQTIVVHREGQLNTTLQHEASEIHSLDKLLH